MAELSGGDKAPDFALEADDGSRFRLADHKGEKLVIYFYPKDDTQGCTLEAVTFTKAAGAFAAADTKVIGISPDTTASHCKFRDKYDLGVTLLADPARKAIESYGVWTEKSMYGRKYMGVD